VGKSVNYLSGERGKKGKKWSPPDFWEKRKRRVSHAGEEMLNV